MEQTASSRGSPVEPRSLKATFAKAQKCAEPLPDGTPCPSTANISGIFLYTKFQAVHEGRTVVAVRKSNNGLPKVSSALP